MRPCPTVATLQLDVRTDAETAVITVEDSGPGLDKEMVDVMFEPFFTTKHAGTGLGLAIVRQMTEAHGGTITVDSKTRTRDSVRPPPSARWPDGRTGPDAPVDSTPHNPRTTTRDRGVISISV